MLTKPALYQRVEAKEHLSQNYTANGSHSGRVANYRAHSNKLAEESAFLPPEDPPHTLSQQENRQNVKVGPQYFQ